MNVNIAKFRSYFSAVAIALAVAASAHSQEIEPPVPELDLLKRDVGKWDCTIKVWPEPEAKPQVSKGSESSRMFGGYWLITEFKGTMMGMDFQGHGNYGYDNRAKKYVGTWIDTLGPYMMHTEGTYDEKTETLTVAGDSPGPDGKTMFTYTMSTCYAGGGRVMTMYMQPKGTSDDSKMKFFEITYTKKKTRTGG